MNNISWLVPMTFISWSHAPHQLNTNRIMFCFEVEGLGVASCFCSGTPLSKTAINPKFKVQQKSHTRVFVRKMLGDKFRSNYDASKGLRAALKDAVLLARVSRTSIDGRGSDAVFKIESICRIERADLVDRKTVEDAVDSLNKLRGFFYENGSASQGSEAGVWSEFERETVGVGSRSGTAGFSVDTGCVNNFDQPF